MELSAWLPLMPVASLASQYARHRQRVAVGAQGDGAPEVVARAGVRRLDVRLLRPGRAVAREDVDRAGVVRRVVVLVAVDARRAAALVLRAHRDRVAVAADGDPLAGMAVSAPPSPK